MFANYLKIALRNLRKYKMFSWINILGLTLGLFSTILIVLFVREELSYDRFHENADRLYRVVTNSKNAGDSISRLSTVGAPWGPMLASELPEVDNFVRFRKVRRCLLQQGENTFYEDGGKYADPQIFELFTFSFLAGDKTTALASPDGIVLTATLAEKLFGKTPAFGKTVSINNRREYIVRAVIADVPGNSHLRFDFLLPYEIHARTHAGWQENWGMFNYHTYLLLNDNADAAAVAQKIPALLSKHISEEWAADLQPYLQAVPDIHLHSDLSSEMDPAGMGSINDVYILAAIAILILIVASINFMNLATARASTRAKEIGIRKVVGARRVSLIAQFIGEALLISLIALVAALGLVELSLPFFNQMLDKQLALNLFTQPGLLFILLAITLLTGIFAGSYPALFLSQIRPAKILKGGSKLSSRGSKLRKTLVITQFAASAVLLAGALTIYQQLQFINSKDPGFNREQVIAIPIDDHTIRRDFDGALQRFINTTGVLDAAISSGELAGGDWAISASYEKDGQLQEGTFRMLSVTHNFIDAMEISLLDGRNFSLDYPTDAKEGIILNKQAADLLGAENIVGKSVSLPGYGRQATVIGVTQDFNFRSLREHIKPMIMFIAPEKYNYFYLRLQAGDISETLNNLKTTWATLSPNFPFAFTFLDARLNQLYNNERKLGETVGYFTILALLVACIGLLGLAAFTVAQRRKEIGVRKVLGASVLDITKMLSLEFAWLVVLANLIAVPIAWIVLNLWLENFAYRIDIGGWIFLLSGGFALLIALAIVSAQAIRAALANPVDALKYE